jgi:DNA-binding transcriptional MerR regulator
MFTVSKLAGSCGLSRSTLLYYESVGLVKPAARTAGNYRSYGETDLRRLQQICVYRDAGLKLADIRAILDRPEHDAASVLQRRLVELDAGIQTLRGHQRAILKLLQNKNSFRRTKRMTKEKWVSIMRASGLSDTDMHRWHIEFERSAPGDHQTFLEFLHIPAPEIRSIREWSRKAQLPEART